MPKIPYDAVNFPSTVPLWRPSAPGNVGPQSGFANVTLAELVAHAATVGDPSLLTGTPARRAIDMRWRSAVVEAALEEANGYWTPSRAYSHQLDSSEKTFVSYLLGMAQASVMAEHILGTVALVHVDAVLQYFGHLYKEKRPDLIGFLPTSPLGLRASARVLIEAKGTAGPKSQSAIDDALSQLKPPPGTLPSQNLQQLASLIGPRGLRVVSHAYFDSAYPGSVLPVWSSHLEDPPSDNDVISGWEDDEFDGLILLAKLLPVVESMNTMQEAVFDWRDAVDTEMRAAAVSPGLIFGLPASLYAALQEINFSLRAYGEVDRLRGREDDLRAFARIVNDLRPDPARLLRRDAQEHGDWEIGKLRSGFCVARSIGDIRNR